MNLFFKSYRICLIFFILITCESGFNRGKAQDQSLFPQPWIQEINLPEIYADISNSSFYLDESGTLFLGKDNGLSVISEDDFYHLNMQGPVYISGAGSDTIFYASKNDMGFLLRDKSASYTIRSQRDRITRATRDFIPRRLICMNGSAFINTDRGVYQNKKGRINYHPFPGNKGRLLKVGDELFLRMSQDEIYIWQGADFQKLTDGEITQNVALLFPGEIENLDGFVFIDYISNREALAISPEYGMVILDKDGVISTAPGKNSGLPDQDIRQIYSRSSGEIWILGSHSLHKMNHPATLNILDLSRQDIGQIYTSKRMDKKVFLGTSKGLFLTEALNHEEGPWTIRHIAGQTSENFRLISFEGNTLFAAGSRRLIAIHNEESEEVSRGNFTGIQALSGEDLVASGENGLLRFERSPEGWIKKIINPEQKNAFSLQRLEQQVFMICNNEIYRLNESGGTGKLIPFHREELLHKLIRIRNILYLISDRGVYRYEKSEENFLPLENDEQAGLLSTSDLILSDEINGLWLVQHLGHYKSKVKQRTDDESSGSEERLYPILENIGEILDLSCRDSVIYLTYNNKIALLKLKTLKKELGGKPPVIKMLNDERKNAFAKGSVHIQLSGLYFQSTPEPEFRFSFDPVKEEWSDWSKSKLLHFNRINPGDYTLYAQSMDLFGRISEPAEIKFSVKSPIYRSWYAYVFYVLVLLAGLFLIRKLRLLNYRLAESRVSQRMQSKLDDLTSEKEKSDKIVADILPDRTAQQMRLGGKAKWDKYERATVLFSDIQGFTKIAEEMNPEALIDELDQFFFHFDSVVDKYNIEKIKTIGDAYMAAGGIPEKNSTNPVEVVLAALEMQAYMQTLKSTKANIWDLRIGVHTGPVIAGVIGHKKVSYDIWGDTVNTASRMESSGIPGKVNISGITYGMVKDYFICEYRGKLPVKYKGNIDMYFVTGLRPELAVDLKGIPNKRFFTKLQILRLGDLEDRVFENILNDLPEKLHFHDIEYARKVYNQSFLLVRAEEVEQQDRLIVRTAALMLFTGLTQAYTNYENRSSVIARDILPEYQYSESQVDKICNLIMSTKLPFQPNNQLEKILIDSKMEYVGKPDYPVRIKELHREMVENGINLNGQQFKKQQLELLYTFDYFTVAARRLREVSGESQQSSLEQERWI